MVENFQGVRNAMKIEYDPVRDLLYLYFSSLFIFTA